MSEDHPLQPQWDWLQRLPVGTKIISKGARWIKCNLDNVIGHGSDDHWWFNLETGEAIHFSFLASEENPPRKECYPSPFPLTSTD